MTKSILIMLMLFPGSLFAQDDRATIYQAYLQGRMDTWKGVMDRLESGHASSGDMTLLYQLTELQYGYIGYCLGADREREAEVELERAERNIQLLVADDPRNPRIYSLMGAFYGFRINLKPLKAPSYGRKSEEANQRALSLGPEEPQAWMEKANIEYYKPAIFGGSKEKAVELYQKAIELFESTPERTSQNWIYLNCMVGWAMACENTGRIRQAGEIYRRLLEMEPSFKWVRDDLYPAYLKNHSAN